MPRPRSPANTSAVALQAGLNGPLTGLKVELPPVGSADTAALARLNATIQQFKSLAAAPLIKQSVLAVNQGQFETGAKLAIKALESDDQNGTAWYVLAFARERTGDFASSLKCFEKALMLLPDHAQIALDLGRLASRLDLHEQAEKLYLHYINRNPSNPDGYNNLSCAMRDQGRYEEAIEVLRETLGHFPDDAMLWNTLGTIMSESGDLHNAQVFYGEALRLQPDFGRARYNLATALVASGDAAGALAHCDEALRGALPPEERPLMRIARTTMLAELGRIGEAWDEYEARLEQQHDDATIFLLDSPRWDPNDDVSGKSLLVIGEQGLGDEVLFANVIEDVAASLGVDGRLTLAVEERLTTLFQRSFPTARVGAHRTVSIHGRIVRTVPFLKEEEREIDSWVPVASLLRRYRRELQDFPSRPRFLTADPLRTAHWREVLSTITPGRRVGLLWKSAIKHRGRDRYFSPFEAWAPVLQTPGITFVNLQYGDCSEELERAKRDFGVEIWTPPSIDLKNDLDDLAALCCAMDLVLGFSNATFNIAAASGAPAWLISTKSAWPRLGTRRYPWYPQAQVFISETDGDWDPLMAEVAAALGEFAEAGTGAPPKG